MSSTDFVQDGNLVYFERKLAEKEQAMADIAFDLELSSLRAELMSSPAWGKFTEIIGNIVHSETEKLASSRMDEYHLGRRQGRITALRTVSRTSPLSPSEIDSLRERATVLRTEIETYRNLLS